MSLKLRHDRHRSPGQCCHDACGGNDVQIAEHDVADHLAVDLGNQRNRSKTTSTQGIDQASLGFLTECKPVHLSNSIKVLVVLKTNEHRNGNKRLPRSHDNGLWQINPAAVTDRCQCQQT